jgi:hypothetical protein
MIVLVPGTVGHLLNSWSARYVPVSRLSQLTLGIPVVAVAMAAVLVGESITLGQVLGIAFTLLSLGVLLRGHAATAPASGAGGERPPPSQQEVAELPDVAAVRDAVVPAQERVHP